MRRFIIFFCLGLMCLVSAKAQTEDYSRPLQDVLNDIQKRFEVRLKIPAELVEGKILPYADYRIRRYSVEESLTNVLAPFDLKYVKEFDKVYKIKAFEYARRTPDQGFEELNYLTGVYKDRGVWEEQTAKLKPCILSALGLDPMPKNPGTKPILTPVRKMNGYQVQNFALEVLPGVYVCGSVYKPAKVKGKCPLIINPNGHFGNGRYREDQQIRCAMFARMGAYAVSYDLFAWGESLLQFESTLHRTEMAHTMQTLNAIRIVDYFSSLKEVDENRIGITGGSGGGSQTMLITAIDDRIKASAPVVMVSSYFIGGCPCESGRPIHLCCGGINNAELAAMAAPRPMLIVSDGKDWSADVPELEYPFISRIYDFYGQKDKVQNVHLQEEGHDYGPNKRKAVYRFFAENLGLNLKAIEDQSGNIDESTCTVEEFPKMYAFGDQGEKLPANAVKGMDALMKAYQEAIR